MKILLDCVAVALVFGVGCARFPLDRTHRNTVPLPEMFASVCGPQKEIPHVEVSLVGSNRSYRIMRVLLSTSPVTENSPKKVLDLECYLPAQTGKCPVAIVLPVSGRQYIVERSMGRYFSARGIASVIVRHNKKNTPRTPEEINLFFKQSVVDNKRVLDWIETCPEFDKNRVGLIGISIGGIKGSLFVAVEPRLKAAVLVLAGEDLPDIIARSKERSVAIRRREYMKEQKRSNGKLSSLFS